MDNANPDIVVSAAAEIEALAKLLAEQSTAPADQFHAGLIKRAAVARMLQLTDVLTGLMDEREDTMAKAKAALLT